MSSREIAWGWGVELDEQGFIDLRLVGLLLSSYIPSKLFARCFSRLNFYIFILGAFRFCWDLLTSGKVARALLKRELSHA